MLRLARLLLIVMLVAGTVGYVMAWALDLVTPFGWVLQLAIYVASLTLSGLTFRWLEARENRALEAGENQAKTEEAPDRGEPQ
jgi:hypothetical protein